MHRLTDDFITEGLRLDRDSTVYIEDGNVKFHMLTQLQPTLGEVCLKLLKNTETDKKHVVFSTDMYYKNSVRSQERFRRAGGNNKVRIIMKGPNMIRPIHFKEFCIGSVQI